MVLKITLFDNKRILQKTQQKTPPPKQMQKAILVLNEILDKKGDETLSIAPIELFESGTMSRTSFFRYFNTIDSIIVLAKAELTEVFTVFFRREGLFIKLSIHDFFMSLFNSLYSHKETVRLLVRRPSKQYWQETLRLIKPIIDRTPSRDEDELLYELFTLVFVHTLEWWIENGFRKEDIPACVDRLIAFIHIIDQSSRQNIFVLKKLLTSIRLMIK